MSTGLDWDEFRIVRAIAEAQSLVGAAETLGLNHSTLFRRLAALEARLGVKLFERDRSGYVPTAAGEDMAALAIVMGDTIGEFERRVAQSDLQVSGRVAVTAPELMGMTALPDVFADLHRAHPNLQLQLLLSDANLELERGHADLAIRVMGGPPSSGLVAQRVSRMGWGVYIGAQAAAGDAETWIASGDGCGPPWADRRVESWRRTLTVSHLALAAELAVRGLGAALLPCFLARTRPELRRLEVDLSPSGAELWLVAPKRALRTPRVRAAYDFLGEALTARRAMFEGDAD